jgi:hypothetical protein
MRPAAAALLAIGGSLILFDLWRLWRWHHPTDDGGYPRAEWSEPHRGQTHLSGYAFRDRDRDGRYDLGDQPMAGVAIELVGPRKDRTIVRSNLSGFANFDMSRSRWRAAIRRPGDYTMAVKVPPGWRLTTANGQQGTRIEALPGAPADLVSANPPGPFGLAPDLVIAGRCWTRRADGALVPASDGTISADGPGARIESTPLARDGSFRFAAQPGPWRIACSRPGGAQAERDLELRDAPAYVAGLVLGEPRSQPAGERTVVDFESITGTPTRKVPSGTAGIDWTYLNAIESVWADGDGYVNTVASGHYVGYSSSGHPVTLAREGGFDLRGGYFGCAHRAAEGETLRLRAYRGGALVAEDEVDLSSLGPIWIDTDYRRVDRVELSPLHYWQFAVDDLELATPDGGAGAPAADSSAGSPSPAATAPPRR